MIHLLFSFLSVLYSLNLNIDLQVPENPTVRIDTRGMLHATPPAYLKRTTPIKKKYTMVVYVDKEDCPICFINHLDEWEIFMRECDENNIPIQFIFIFCPIDSELDMFTSILSSSSISYLSYVDSSRVFEEMNPWIKKSKFKHTFIIDENMRPKFVDAPPYDRDFMEMLRNL